MSALTDFEMVDVGELLPLDDGPFVLDEDDFLLYGMLLDPIYHPELMWRDPENFEYEGQYRVRDYQFIINRLEDQNGRPESYAIVSCARSVGKTESEKVHMEIHPLKEYGNMLVTAPELIHLLPLTDAVEDNIQDSTLLRELLDTRNGQTGFQHRPFQANFDDGTKIVGRIPRLKGPQPLDAKILTPTGWTTMGDVAVGDLVVGADGKATEVLEVHEIGEREIFELRFNDNSRAKATADHRWLVAASNAPTPWRIRLTGEIAEDLRTKTGKQLGGPRNRWKVPPAPLVEFDRVDELPVDPYLLGVLLGDGGLTQRTIALTLADAEIVQWVREALPADCELVKRPERKYSYYLRTGGCRGRGVKAPLRVALEQLGLLGCKALGKFIPERYLYASAPLRLALLQGLMDTDGSVGTNGRTTFTSQSERLVRDVAQLARSLGMWASVRSQMHKPYMQTLAGKPYQNKGGWFWRVALSGNKHAPVRLARKRERLKVRKERHRQIVEIVPAGRAQTRCISVAAQDELYLTDELIVTANTGLKGQHQKKLIVEEGQDFPEAGWSELPETVNYDARDRDGNPDFTFWIYGVHSGDRSSQFDEYARSALYRKIKVTALRRPDWGPERKANAIAAYGGTSSPDYKRNILGEPGSGATSYFVVARVMACVDQNTTRGEVAGSDYNEHIYVKQRFRAEELDDLDMKIGELLDLPKMTTGGWWGGVDIGLTDSPTVITLFAEWQHQKKRRLTLMRRFTLERFRPKQIREALYAIGWHFGTDLLGIGVDVTGLGRPIFQDMEDDELCPPHLRDVTVGYTFNSNVEVAVSPSLVTENQGVLRDHLGNMVKVIEDEVTGEKSYVVMQPFIAASTQFIRDDIDDGTYLLPFDTDVISDMLQETKQRVDRVGKRGEGGGQRVKKGDRFHILDAIRAMAYRRRQDEILAKLAPGEQQSVFDVAGLEDGPLDLGSFTAEQIAGVLGQI